MGSDNAVSVQIDDTQKIGDGRARYPQALRLKMYTVITDVAKRLQPGLEEAPLWQGVGLRERMGKCNCAL